MCDVEFLVGRIRQVGDRAVRGVSDIMQEEGEAIAQLAREFAPVDQGNLEEAIKVEVARGGSRGRISVDVYIDPDMPAPHINPDGTVTKGTESKTVGDYAAAMHEGLAPYGSGAFKLGPRSLAKAASGAAVGGKFLERALAKRARAIFLKVSRAVKAAIK